jgi:ABC-2 type transport system ATP-binding protein
VDGEYVVGQSILELIQKRLSEERDLGDCVELGCGTGYLTRAIAGNARHVTATDLSEEMLQVAQTQLGEFQHVTIQKAECTNTGFPAESFDSVLLANLIHVIEDPLPCLQESHRILREEGRLLVVDLTSCGLPLIKKARLGLRYLRTWGPPPRHGQNHLSPEDLARLARSAGFRVEDLQLLQAEMNAVYLRGRKGANHPLPGPG